MVRGVRRCFRLAPGAERDFMSSPQEKSTQNQPSVKAWASVKQTITADHHLDPKQSAIEQNRWPRISAPTMKGNPHAKETRPTRDAAD